MIEVEGLTKLYGDFKAIDRISFEVKDGEIVGLLGPNGAGKTTTMKILTCFMPATYGKARVAGHDIFEEPMAVKRQLGYLPEVPPLYGEMSVRGYVEFVAELKEVPGRDRTKKVRRALEETGTWDVRDRLIENLSRGYKQRVGLAQALVHDPKLLVLDEPTTGLDPKQIIEIRELIRNLGQERTIILSTHILPEVHMTCEKIIVINEGRIAGIGTETELSKQVLGADFYLVRALGPRMEVAETLGKIASVHRVVADDSPSAPDVASFNIEAAEGRDPREEIFFALADRKWPLLELRPPEISLEQVFIKLTATEEESRRLTALSNRPSEVTASNQSSSAQASGGSGDEEYQPRLGPVAQFLTDRGDLDKNSKKDNR